ncbi:MAG TPA: hypothetical protein DDW30_09160 [Clostridiales bacterium]|nr:hypothetical protein [Clostridiales bacterium]
MRNPALRKKRLLLFVTLAVVLAVNLAAVLLPYRAAHPDVSGNGVYTLTNTSRNYVKALDRDVQITYYAADPDPDLRSFLDLYKASHVTVKVSEPPTADEDQTIRIACGEDARTVGVSDLFYYSSTTYSPEYGYLSMTQYARITAEISAMSSSDEAYQAFTYYFGPDVMQAHFCGEEVITSTLRNLVGGTLRTVWVLTGEVGQAPDRYVMLRLKLHGFEARGVSETNLSSLPDGSLLWLTPQKDLDADGAAALEDFLSRGGRLFLTTLYSQMQLPKLMEVLAAYGLSAETEKVNLVGDTVSSGTSSTVSATFSPKRSDHAINETVGSGMMISYAHEIRLSAVEGVENASLLKTSTSGQSVEQSADGEGEQTETAGTFTVAATAVRSSDSSRVAWLGMLPTSNLDYYADDAESTYTAAILSWLAGADLQFPIGEPHVLPSALLNVSVTVFVIWIIIFAVLLPLSLLAVALVRRYVRRKG